MFTIFHTYFTRYPMLSISRERLLDWLDFYAATTDGVWLKSIDYRHDVTFYWCDAMRDSDVMGAKDLLGNTIYLQNESPDAMSNPHWDPANWAMLIAPTAIHELRHLWQRRKLGIALYIVLAFPWLREVTIEKDAWRITKAADSIISTEDARRCAEAAEKRQKKVEAKYGD